MNRAILFLAALPLLAHVGSPDIFHEGSAGPYPLFVTIRPPAVIPGVAQIEIRSASPAVREIRITPTPLTGEGAKFAPAPDIAERSKQDSHFYTGSLWMMATGSWQVRIRVEGANGPGEMNVPVPSVPLRTANMQFAMAAGLFVMMLVLAFGIVSIVGAGVREGQLEPGAAAGSPQKRRARIAMGAAGVLVALILWGGNSWWSAEAATYAGYIYKPLEMAANVEPGDKLVLRLSNPGWLIPRRLDDFLPDHNHLMHLYVVRFPDFDRVWHLHPEMGSSGVFEQRLPPMPEGTYKLYADVVHRDGLPETMTAEIRLPAASAGSPLQGDDSGGPRADSPWRIVWDRPTGPVRAKEAQPFRFRMVDASGTPAPDIDLYMGMPGHAAFIKDDGSVFAHVHPSGSVPMAALALANRLPDHSGHQMSVPPEASFPYGFPQAGRYKIIVQMKRQGVVETAIFDVNVE